MTLGWIDHAVGPAGVAQHGGALTTATYDGELPNRDWSHNPDEVPPAKFIRNAHAHGLMPYLLYFEVQIVGEYKNPAEYSVQEDLKILEDTAKMRMYWNNVKKFLKAVGSADEPAALSLESSFWSLLEQQQGFVGLQPDAISVKVASTGVPELAHLNDTLVGFVDAWRILRDRYAPQAILVYPFAPYGADNVSLPKDTPPRSVLLSSAEHSAQWFERISPDTFQMAAFSLDDTEYGQDPNPELNWTDAKKELALQYIRRWTSLTRIPVVWESTPVGNTIYRTIDNKPYHWSDTWAQWLLRDGARNLVRSRDAGVIGVYFGVTSGLHDPSSETCPCDAAHDGITNGGRRGLISTSPDDDGGYIAAQMGALARRGGLPLR
jgi:hypothetical protein